MPFHARNTINGSLAEPYEVSEHQKILFMDELSLGYDEEYALNNTPKTLDHLAKAYPLAFISTTQESTYHCVEPITMMSTKDLIEKGVELRRSKSKTNNPMVKVKLSFGDLKNNNLYVVPYSESVIQFK